MKQVTLRGFLNGEFTRQQYFDFVCTKLLEQGAPCVGDESNYCVYNGPNDTHCGIGWTVIGESVLEEETIRSLLTGDLAKHDGECDDGWVLFPGMGEAVDREVDFLHDLQRAHDDTTLYRPMSPFVPAFKDAARGVARSYDLNTLVLDAPKVGDE